MKPRHELSSAIVVLSTIGFALASCSDDDGANVQPNSYNVGGSSGSGMSGSAGDGGAGGGASGSGGMSGAGGGMGGSSGVGGSAGCTPVSIDAGVDAGDAGDSDASSDGSAPVVLSFATDIHPIFVSRCTPCHVEDNSGGHNVGGPDVDDAYSDAVRKAEAILERVNGGGMPPSYAAPPNNCADGDGPGDPGCISVEEYALIQTWVDQCYPR